MENSKNRLKNKTVDGFLSSQPRKIIQPPISTKPQIDISMLQSTENVLGTGLVSSPNEPSLQMSEHISAPPTSSGLQPTHKTDNKQFFSLHFVNLKSLLAHKKIATTMVVGFIVIASCSLVVVSQKSSKQSAKSAVASAPISTPTPTPVPTPITEPSTLSGLSVEPSINKRAVTAVMIENSLEARPQSGLLKASIIYEAIAEGGITRFLALFQDQTADRIGPVRSVRPYYIDWLRPYDPSIAHVGGSQDALAQIKKQGLKDLDQFYNDASYSRIKERFAPHNVYTSSDRLTALQNTKGYTSSTFTSFSRKPEAKLGVATATSIDIAISGYLYNVHYDYDQATNSYLRSEGSKPHVDEVSKEQLKPKVVIAFVVPSRNVQASDGWRTEYDTVGAGKALLFQDGGLQSIQWKKPSSSEQIQLLDDSGTIVPINPGQTWLTAIDSIGKVTTK